MASPGTQFIWHDLSYINNQNDAQPVEYAPLFLTASSFVKGPEDMRVVSGNQFYQLYGAPSFDKDGQPAIQAARIIDAGGRLLVKRVVADDATLANIILVANVNENLTATPDTTGSDEAKTINQIMGRDTSSDTDATTRYIVSSASTIKWTAVSMSDIKEDSKVLEYAQSLLVEGERTDSAPDASGVITITSTSSYPLFVICDNGRGISNKAVKFIPNFNVSKNIDYFFYNMQLLEGTSVIDKQDATLNPNSLVNNQNFGFNEFTSIQVKFYNVEDAFTKYVDKLAGITGLDSKTIAAYDLIFLNTNKRFPIPNISIAEDSINLNSETGIALTNGTNGTFGDAPFGTQAYADQCINFFNGTFNDAIFDLDDYKIAAIFDANYPLDVKEAIAELVTFREDCFYFRDLGIDVASYSSIIEAENKFHHYNRYIGDYLTTYNILNPENGKRIKVSMMYDLAGIMVNHFINGAFRPTAGSANGMVLASAIPGTVNFTPRITPAVNQKSLLEDVRINYAIFQDDQCVVQSLYTSQEPYTQLSYINNVLAIQEVARNVRTACPKVRYTFASGSDFSKYAEEVSKVLSNFTDHFAELGFSYEQDSIHASQKIFYAVITFRFNNWAQTEIFDLYALPSL